MDGRGTMAVQGERSGCLGGSHALGWSGLHSHGNISQLTESEINCFATRGFFVVIVKVTFPDNNYLVLIGCHTPGQLGFSNRSWGIIKLFQNTRDAYTHCI